MTTPARAPIDATRPTSPARDNAVRTDIQALRAFAVGSVMLYHLWPNRLPGGYVGVDVFFVISGFLISTHLLGEIRTTGRTHLATFWARRAKRLIPASALVLLATSVATVLWVPRYLWQQFFVEISASVLQFQNWLLAHDAVDYLAANNPPSPTQHFWTLSAEEQFYVGMPLLLLATGLLGRNWRRRRTVIGVALVVVAVSSFAYSVTLTASDPGLAYFSTFTRAWEFALGGLLALRLTGVSGGHRRGRHRRDRGDRGLALRNVAAGAGVLAVAATCVWFTAATPFPGAAAALPVFGTLFVLACGRGTFVARLGVLPPIAMLGRVSYAAYLWHWPILVVLPFVTGHALTTTNKLSIIVATLIISWASTTFVEDPVRFNPRLLGRRRPRVVAAWTVLPVLMVLAVSFLARDDEADRQRTVANEARKVLSDSPRCLGAQALDPKLTPCDNPELNGKLYPDVAHAVHDDASLSTCWAGDDGTAHVCHLGPSRGYTKSILAIGDSHNNVLTDVYRAIAKANNWRIDAASKESCYLTAATQKQKADALLTACATWKRQITAIARAGDYDAVITTHAGYGPRVTPAAGKSVDETTVDGIVAAWNTLPDVPIVAIRDNPTVRPDNLACVELHRANAATACGTPRTAALRFDGQQQAAEQVARATVLDFTSLYCTADQCPAVVGNVLVYRDQSHLTRTYTQTIAPYVEQKVVAALKRRPA